METEVIQQRKKIHPHKFTLWVGIGSIIMMFAGLTSAYIVKRNQINWVSYDLPKAFWYSTIVIVVSSITIQQAVKAFKERAMANYRKLVLITMVLGVLFLFLQTIGFIHFWESGMTLQKNVSFSFLYVIVGLHALHIAGGIIALMIMSLKSFSKKKRVYTSIPIELMSTYWHFVDILWVYLLVFLIMIK